MQVKSYCLAICMVICAFTTAAAQSISTTQYIDSYKHIAMEEMRRSGVPAAIKLAQGILETQSGNGWLVLNSNNHFGIKCKNNWTGKSVNYDDDAKGECFRKYDSPEESWKDHSDFLRNNPRYKFLFDYAADDYKSWAYGLKTAGYATSRTYPQQLIQIIEKYNLQEYTTLAMSNKALPQGPVFAGPPVQRPQDAPVAREDYTPAKVNYPQHTEFRINGRKVVYVKEGTALIQVANAKNIRLSNLLKMNDLDTDVPLEKDMLIFLQSKHKKGKNDYHIVAPGETLHDIAQAEGVQLRWLRKRNKMQEGEQPAAGEKIVLDGYASVKPKLGSHSVVKADEHKDLEPRKIIRDIREEIEKAGNPQASTPEAPAAPAAPVAQQPAAPKQTGLPPEMVEELKKIGTSSGTGQYHIVAQKETLYSISKKYNITVAQLQAWNNLSDNGIRIGQQLIVRK